MARIRIIDEWLRSPVSPPTRRRAILVVARSWGEQRVLMRAFANCDDQTRPTIHMQGEVLAIGPAGVDPHGQWGIHVDPPVDGRAQELRVALQQAARIMAGSKGNPPRLQDEVPAFDDKATHMWSPKRSPNGGVRPQTPYYEPAEVAHRIPQENLRVTPALWALGDESSTSAPPTAARLGIRKATRTLLGYASYENPELTEDFVGTASKTLPTGLILDADERCILDALSHRRLTQSDVAKLLGIPDSMEWMAKLMDKLAGLGLDLVRPGDDMDGEPTYMLTR